MQHGSRPKTDGGLCWAALTAPCGGYTRLRFTQGGYQDDDEAMVLTKQRMNHGSMVLHPTSFIWSRHGPSWRSRGLVAIDKPSRRRNATRSEMFDRVLQALGVRPTERCKRACRYEYYCRLRDRINGEIDLRHAKEHLPPEHLRGLSMAAIDNLITKALAAFEQYGEISCRDMLKPAFRPFFFPFFSFFFFFADKGIPLDSWYVACDSPALQELLCTGLDGLDIAPEMERCLTTKLRRPMVDDILCATARGNRPAPGMVWMEALRDVPPDAPQDSEDDMFLTTTSWKISRRYD